MDATKSTIIFILPKKEWMAMLCHMNATQENCAQKPKMGKTLRARCGESLPTNVNEAARIVGMKPADFVRIVLENTTEIVARGGRSAFYRLYAAN